jgi:hypothetical protein
LLYLLIRFFRIQKLREQACRRSRQFRARDTPENAPVIPRETAGNVITFYYAYSASSRQYMNGFLTKIRPTASEDGTYDQCCRSDGARVRLLKSVYRAVKSSDAKNQKSKIENRRSSRLQCSIFSPTNVQYFLSSLRHNL